jgi:predicted NBD/HSP70 family sugar kinase
MRERSRFSCKKRKLKPPNGDRFLILFIFVPTNRRKIMHGQLLKEIEMGSKNAQVKKKIITHYIYNGSSTIAELSKELDLSVPTVTKFVSEMCEEEYLNDYGKLETNGGRHPNLYGLNPDSGYFIGVDVKRFAINIGLMNFKGDMLEFKMDIPYNLENSIAGLNEICRLVQLFISTSKVDKNRILNVNVNISGRVNPDLGYSFSLFNFEERPLAEILSERLHYKVTIDNDTRAMAYGEFMGGCVTGEKNILFINVGWGLGLGVIIEGKIYAGKSGFSGEFGHVSTFDNEIMCHCGKKGCLETEASGSALYRILNERVRNGESSILSKRIKANELVTLDDVIGAVMKEDILCIEIVEEIGQKLGKQIAGLINIFNPELVIIGGTLSQTEDYICQPIKTAIRKYSLNLVNKDSVIKTSKLKEKAGIVGACMIARSRMFEIS